MIIKKMFLMMKKNGMTLLWAAILASGIFYVVNNPDFFSASVLSLQEKAFIAEQWRDIAYKTDNGYMDIFMSERLENPKSMDFTISFDKDTVIIDPQNISGQGTRIFSNPDENTILIQSIANENVDRSQSLILLPFTGDIEDILLSEAVARLDGGGKKDLSIWSLNIITSHSK